MSEEKKFYTTEEVSDMLHVSRQAIYHHVKAGKLKATKFGKRWLFPAEPLHEYLRNHMNV